MKNSVIFDLDGTLWEVLDTTHKSVNVIAKKHNLKEVSKDRVYKVFGLNKEGCAKIYFPDMELDKSVKLVDEIAVVLIDNLKKQGGNIYPNVETVLKMLSEKYDLYIVSNTAEIEYIRASLNTGNIKEYFKGYIAASSLNISKGEAIRKVIEDNKIEKAVYVGDTIIDLEATKISNVPFIQAKYGFGDDLGTKFSINDINELPNVVEEVFEV